MATKEHKRYARGLIEGLESRVHVGPPVRDVEILSAREFLRDNGFSPASDYFSRLTQVQQRLETRSSAPALLPAKRNYGGEASGRWMQLQSAYDHVILSTCYEGDCNFKHGRVKISHRFNQEGRVDFVELKFLRSLHPCLNGEIRLLLRISDYPSIRKDWRAAEAFVLPLLPQELIFLYPEFFRCRRSEALAWLVNIGHRMIEDLLRDLSLRSLPDAVSQAPANGEQLPIEAVRLDEVAFPILENAAALECALELDNPKTAQVRYLSRQAGFGF
jgi:hypothetical protein